MKNSYRNYMLNISKIVFSLFLALIALNPVFAQNKGFDLESFDYDKEKYKEAKAYLSNGYDAFDREYYYEAFDWFKLANELNPDNADLNYDMGVCRINSSDRFLCLEYFERAFQLNRLVSKDIHYMLARGLHLNMQFDQAINEYKAHLGILENEELTEQKTDIEKYIYECKVGKEMVKAPANSFVDNVGDVINTKYHEHSPLISADESMLIFTSTQDNGRKKDRESHSDEDIYMSFRENKEWIHPINIGAPVNTQFNDATVGLSPDGQKLLIYNGNRGGGDIQYCLMEGDTWNYPKSFTSHINSDFKESSACYSPDGNQLYFVSDRPGGFGGKDIYVSRKNAKGKWGEAKNLGDFVNSEYDEETVFIHPDGRKLYYSSGGHNSMGGFDIFVSYLNDNNSWSVPENMGFPVNSPDDDLCFVISANGRHGYFSSVRGDSYGGLDIFRTTFLGPEKPLTFCNEDNLIAVRSNPISEQAIEESVELKTIRLTIVKGLVLDAFSKEPVFANIDIVDNNTGEVIFTSQTNSATGKFLVTLPSGKNYALTVKADEYLFHSENFNIPQATEYQEIEKKIDLNNLKKDAKIVLNNVFYETGSATLKPTSYAELGRLTKLLNDHPKLHIEISGHTDNVGSKTTNQKLSESRAKSVVEFLISEGIESLRLEYKGYAFDQPLADNSTKEGRSRNRRVEFKVINN